MVKQLLILALLFTVVSCNNKKVVDEKAAAIVKAGIETFGGKHYDDMDLSFDFRQFRVHLVQEDGKFLYERTTTDSMNNVWHDVLTNSGFTREKNGEKQELTEKDFNKYKEGINAIAYFMLLPYKLSEPAVNLKYVGEATIENKKYDKVAVSFNADGGGKDHLDEFCFWFGQSDHSMDFLSYSNGGPRMRKAVKKDTVAGIIFQNYENYLITDSTIETYNYDKEFTAGRVKLLSKIEQQNYTDNKPAKK